MEHVKCAFCGKRHPLGPQNCPELTQPLILKRKAEPKPDTVTPEVTPVTNNTVTRRKVSNTVTHCPTCTCGNKKVYQSNAERQRAYRERKSA